METKGWDVFRVLPPEQDSSSEAMNKRCMSITVRILKVIAYVVSFCVVLGGCVISKSTLLFMTSQVSNSFYIRVKQSSESHLAVVRQSSGGRQAVVMWSSGGRQAVVRRSSGSRQGH